MPATFPLNTPQRVEATYHRLRGSVTRDDISSVLRVAENVIDFTTAPQRQDSMVDQLLTVVSLAQAAGCYDAADLIQEALIADAYS